LETPAGSISLETRLVIAADGTDSAVRRLAGIGSSAHDYGQTALVGALALARDLDGRAYERLSEDGPVALLPLAGQRAGFIWTMASSRVAATLALDDAAFVAALQQHFGWRAGRFRRAGRRQPWPLKLVLADALIAARVVLVGNAAQTIHPLGAQGFNLGLRDAMQLAEVLRECARRGADPGAPDLLARYAKQRGPDRAATLDFSDGLTRLAARAGTLANGGRSLALTLVERMPLLKQDLAFALMGYRQSGAA
jgi:2-octaprenyl-6-methoxyphenol hydroxylase